MENRAQASVGCAHGMASESLTWQVSHSGLTLTNAMGWILLANNTAGGDLEHTSCPCLYSVYSHILCTWASIRHLYLEAMDCSVQYSGYELSVAMGSQTQNEL